MADTSFWLTRNCKHLSDVNQARVRNIVGCGNLGDGRVIQRRNLIKRVARFDGVLHCGRSCCRTRDDEHLSDINQIVVCDFIGGGEGRDGDAIGASDAIEGIT